MNAEYKHVDCDKFERCSAPLCPLDHPERVIFYTGEPTCSKRPLPKWVKKQRRLTKKGANGYFTLAMLMTQTRNGIDPDKNKKVRNA